MSAGTKAVLVAVAGVLAGVLVAIGIVAWAGSGGPEFVGGDDEFEAGRTEVLAEDIEENGQPLIFPDLVGGDRDIWVQHVSDDPAEGWLAFETRIPGELDCQTEWDAAEQVFVSSCDESVTFPADGDGLRQYPTEVDDDDRLIIDLRG